MNEQQVEFANTRWKYDLSHETNLRFNSPKFDVYLYADGSSFPPLESELDEVLNPLLTTPSVVTASSPSTLRDNTVFTMTFPDPPFPLAQLTEFEVGDTLGISASVDVDDTCFESGDTFIEVNDFDMTLVGRSYVDDVVIVPTSPKCHNMLLVNYHDVLEGNKDNLV